MTILTLDLNNKIVKAVAKIPDIEVGNIIPVALPGAKIIGKEVENVFGKVKYLIIYLLSGIAGSILSLAFNHNTICAGASGAIFGLLGALLYFGYYYRTYLGATLTRSIIPVIVLNLIIGFTSSGIDNAAHIGGLVGGILIAMAVGVPDKSNNNNKINGIVLSLIYFGFIIYLSFFR